MLPKMLTELSSYNNKYKVDFLTVQAQSLVVKLKHSSTYHVRFNFCNAFIDFNKHSCKCAE